MEFKVTLDQINKVLQYLGSKPYSEVYEIINMISKFPAIETPEQESNPEGN